MSDRLISADKAKEVLKHLLYETAMNNLDIADIYEDIAEKRLETWLGLVPTVVEMVYCKDCKWFDDCECRLEEDVQGIRRMVALKDYCSFGERK